VTILYDENLRCMIIFLYDVMMLYDVIWYFKRHGVSLWYDMFYLTRYMIWYDWQKVCWIGIMHNLDIHMKSCDRMKWKEKSWDAMHHCAFMHRRILLLLRLYGCIHYEAGKRSLYYYNSSMDTPTNTNRWGRSIRRNVITDNPSYNNNHWPVNTLHYKPNNTFLCYLSKINVSKIGVTIPYEQ